MIIPPDPEKDPQLFTESRTSLTTDADLISFDEPSVPEVAYSRDLLYSGGPFADDFAVYEQLPPYEGRRAGTPTAATATAPAGPTTRVRRSARNSNYLIRINSSSSSSSLGSSSSRASMRGTASGSAIPINLNSTSPSSTAVATDRSKVWEGVDGKSPHQRRLDRLVTPRVRAAWMKHRRWLIIAMLIVSAVLLVAIGLAVGLGVSLGNNNSNSNNPPPKKWKDWPAPNALVQMGSLNITYVPRRDDPKSQDGEPFECNTYAPLNSSTVLGQLALTNDVFDQYLTTYHFNFTSGPKAHPAFHDPFYFIAHGLAASGTVEFVGTDAPAGLQTGGTEGAIRIDVIARSPKGRELDTLAKVCKLRRPDGSVGFGIFTPVETDSGGAGGASPYLLNPLQTPAFHVVIRMPPSSMNALPQSSVKLANMTFSLGSMSVRMGKLYNVASFGSLSFAAECRGGGIVMDYVEAVSVSIAGSEGTVQGTFNISSSLNINSTSGAIFANVILNDPNLVDDTSVTLTTSAIRLRERRGYSGSDNYRVYADSEADANQKSYIPPRTHFVNNTFITKEGFIFVSYLHHPPTTALQSFVASQTGMVDVSMHPNYIGTFALVNLWGSIRLPQLTTPVTSDPQMIGRRRVVTTGPIDVSASTMYGASGGYDEMLESSASSVTGAALWAYPGAAVTALTAQKSPEGKGSALYALANYGDLLVTFDGT
jgi:hypothetical protein